MRSLVVFLQSVFLVMCANTVIRDAIYQIQGVQINDSIVYTRHEARTRVKRQIALDPPSPSVVNAVPAPSAPPASSSHAHARMPRHYASPGDAYPQQFQQQQLQQQQFQQPQFLPQQQLQRLPADGFSGQQQLQQQSLFGQLLGQLPQPQKPEGPRYPTGRAGKKAGSKKGTQYFYPPRMPLPLPQCFHNPTGYVCCNEELNDLMVDTYTTLEQRPKFHNCNIQLIATHLQLNAQRHFNTSFETVVSYEDFAQKINFRGDMVCKIELGNRFLLAYATATDSYNHDLAGNRREKRDANVDFDWSSGTAESWHSIHTSLF